MDGHAAGFHLLPVAPEQNARYRGGKTGQQNEDGSTHVRRPASDNLPHPEETQEDSVQVNRTVLGTENFTQQDTVCAAAPGFQVNPPVESVMSTRALPEKVPPRA